MNRGAFDFECYDWVNPRCCGLLYGVKGERQWDFFVDERNEDPKSIARNVLQFMSTFPADTKQWWAHNGGKFDVLFLLEALEPLGFNASAFVSGGRVITLKVHTPNGTFSIQDSYSVIPSSLKKAAESFQCDSRKIFTDDDYSQDVRTWSLQRLEDGCRADCEVVLELLDKAETLFESEGGKLKTTFSSSAFSVVQSHANIVDMRKHEHTNRVARRSYHGGRVEVYKHTPQYNISEWDINSSYPASMSRVLPWEFRGFYSRNRSAHLYSSGHEGMVEASIFVSSQYLPVLPWRHPVDDGLYFPTGQWRAWFSACELRYAVSVGSAKINKIFGFLDFKAKQPFEAMIASFYKLKAESTGAKREFYKLCLNGSYGKFAQKPEKEELRIFSSEKDALAYVHEEKNRRKCRFVSKDNLKYITRDVFGWSKQTHFALASYITAYSRILLHGFLSNAKRIAYADTDSVHADASSDLPVSNALGALKLERKNIRAIYAAPKIYSLASLDGSEETHYALKGFPVDASSFAEVISEGSVTRERMALAKSQLRKGSAPMRVKDSKTWSGRSMKRRPLYGTADGDTEPWHVKDLLNDAHKKALSPVATGRARKKS